MPQISDELVRAINYANRNGVICVASTGNDGQRTFVYPAGLSGVIGVASVSQGNLASSFTNYGKDLVTVATVGEGLVTTYFGSHYAAVWGTSFSSGLVAGAAADLLTASDNNTRHQLMFNDVQRALANGVTKEELSEVITHLAFYAGWPAAMSAANIAREVFEANP